MLWLVSRQLPSQPSHLNQHDDGKIEVMMMMMMIIRQEQDGKNDRAMQ